MKYVIDNEFIDVLIIRKNNKNTYVRVKDKKIYVTTNKYTSEKQIKDLLDNNYENIKKMYLVFKKKEEKNTNFYYLGKYYDVIIVPTLKIEIDERIFVQSYEFLNKWLSKQTKLIFNERLNYWYNEFKENIPFPKLRIRKMSTRWGVCNKKLKVITLNSELIKYGYDEIDYVIIHELSHFIYFDHSKNFWNLVSYYCPNYKEIRKVLKEQ